MTTKDELKNLSQELLHLHKALLNFAQAEYEDKFGKIPNSGKLLELLMSNASFAWLRAVSSLIVSIDELVDSTEPMPEQQIADLIAYTKGLLTTTAGSEFSIKYAQSLQKDPHVAVAHGKVMQLLK